MKRRRIERERRAEAQRRELDQKRARDMAAAEQNKRIRRLQHAVMIASILGGLLIAGLVRKYFGEEISFSYAGRLGWTGDKHDPLIGLGLIGGAAIGEAACWLMGRQERRKRN